MKTKTQLSQGTIRTLIKDAFGSQSDIHEVQELQGGYYNAAYLVTLSDSMQTVLKVAPPDDVDILLYERDIMRTEIAMYHLLAERAQVPLPRLLAYNTGRRLLNQDYLFLETLRGTPWNELRDKLTQEENQRLEYQLGQYLAEINAIHGEYFGYFTMADDEQNSSWTRAFLKMITDLLNDGERFGSALPMASHDILQLVYDRAAALDEVKTPRLVHWDLWPGNVFVHFGSGRPDIEGLIDFERAFWGDPLAEYNFNDTVEGTMTASLLAGYGASMLEAPHAVCRRCVYNIYLYLVMVIECASRMYPTDDQEKRAFSKLTAELERLQHL